ncbi:MAG: porin [Halothiobacillaceae bacterium]
MKSRALLVSCGCLAMASASQAANPINDTLSWSADLRGGYFSSDRDARDGSSDTTDELRARIRLGLEAELNDSWRAKARFAGRYSTYENNNHFKFFTSAPSTDGLRRGDSTIDELYLSYRPDDRWEVTLGRMQTKFELTGVAKKSLDRNDSPNVDITWTDGLRVTRKGDNGWNSHFILQRNRSVGPTNVMRSPLNFSKNGSRVMGVYSLESTKPVGPVVQRAIDINYLPDALHRDGTETGRIKDYWGLVGRLAAQWPLGNNGTKFMLAGEGGYAPNTPTEAAMNTGTSGDAGGLAGQVSFNFIDIVPRHSFALVYGQAQSGWLLSPDFRNNNSLIEGRYQWRISSSSSIEARLRERKDLDSIIGAQRDQTDRDVYVRYTHKF